MTRGRQSAFGGPSLCRFTGTVGKGQWGQHRQDNVVLLLIKLEHELNVRQLIDCAKIYGRRRAYKIHRVSARSAPGTNFLEIKAGIFLLEQYSHMLLRSRIDCFSARMAGCGTRWIRSSAGLGTAESNGLGETGNTEMNNFPSLSTLVESL